MIKHQVQTRVQKEFQMYQQLSQNQRWGNILLLILGLTFSLFGAVMW